MSSGSGAASLGRERVPGPSLGTVITRLRQPLSPSTYHRITVLALVFLTLIVVTGAGWPPHRFGPRLHRLAHLHRDGVRGRPR